MKIKIATNLRIKKVNAEFAFEMYGHQFVIHKEIDGTKWGDFDDFTVSELSTGRRVANDFSEKFAIERAKRVLENNGEKMFLKQVGKYPLINAPRKVKKEIPSG